MLAFLDISDGSFAKSKHSKLEEGGSPESLTSVTEETDLAGNVAQPVKQECDRFVSTECTSMHYKGGTV